MPMKILIVEDELKMAEYLHRGLSEQDCAVDVAHNGVDGQHMALNYDYDVIVLDVMLPGLDGFSILRSLRAVKSTPVIMLTARDRVEDRVKDPPHRRAKIIMRRPATAVAPP